MASRTPLPALDARATGSPERARPLTVGRFESCLCVLRARPESEHAVGPLLAYRRCPVGVIASVDCPEFAGLTCRHFVDRAEVPAKVVGKDEEAWLATELARDYLTARYLRRLRPLRFDEPLEPERGAELLARAPVGVEVARSAAHGSAALSTPAPVNVPADRDRGGPAPVSRCPAPTS